MSPCVFGRAATARMPSTVRGGLQFQRHRATKRRRASSRSPAPPRSGNAAPGGRLVAWPPRRGYAVEHRRARDRPAPRWIHGERLDHVRSRSPPGYARPYPGHASHPSFPRLPQALMTAAHRPLRHRHGHPVAPGRATGRARPEPGRTFALQGEPGAARNDHPVEGGGRDLGGRRLDPIARPIPWIAPPSHRPSTGPNGVRPRVRAVAMDAHRDDTGHAARVLGAGLDLLGGRPPRFGRREARFAGGDNRARRPCTI